ncbi:MAG: hypothetical protein ICV70_03595 [Jiangellaceae bacterium]|nr:hypothetical protein [Jiangellaceae bacterium]
MLASLLTLVLLGAGAMALLVWWIGGSVGPLVLQEVCSAEVGGQQARLGPEQAVNAATIAAVAERRGLPARAVTIALAAAYQESDLRNLDHGDRDSLGLFQQRPSQGWGSPDQILDPVYATDRFYDALVKVPDYRELPITVAAQRVQRSAYPDAYADHEARARALASALSGNSAAAFGCAIRLGDYAAEQADQDGLTARARVVRDELGAAFGALEIGGYRAGGVESGHIDGSAHYDGRALDVFFREYDDPQVRRSGWVVAHWLVANADRLGLATVIYDARIWTARRSSEGWRPYTHPSGDATNPTLQHLDHVHVDVARGN